MMTQNEFDIAVEKWHAILGDGGNQPLHVYMGMTLEEYTACLTTMSSPHKRGVFLDAGLCCVCDEEWPCSYAKGGA